MEAHREWAEVNETSDVIRLLGIIQGCMTEQQTRRHPVHSLCAAEATVYTLKQKPEMSNNDYYEKFKDAVATAERLGSNIGVHQSRVDEVLADPARDPIRLRT
jgi:hypothetical protein